MKQKVGLFWIALAATLWSVQGVLGKANAWSPLTMTAVRAVFAALVIGIARGSLRPSKERINWIAAIFVAATGLLFLSANSLTTAANAIVIQYMMPVFVILTSWVIWRQKPTRVDIICSVIMLGGVALCFLSGISSGRLAGNLLAVLSAASYAGVYLSSKARRSDVLSYAYQGFLLSTLLLLTIPFDGTFVFTGRDLLSTAAMGVCVGLGYICFAKGFSMNVNPVNASVISYIEPVLNPLWVSLFIHEEIGSVAGIGIAVVLITALCYSIIPKQTAKAD